VGSGRTTALWTRGRHGSSASRAREWRGVYDIMGSRRTMLMQAQKWRGGLGDEACVVDGTTGSGPGRWRCVRALTVVGNDGAEASRRTQ
jgi:hypothetical protein